MLESIEDHMHFSKKLQNYHNTTVEEVMFAYIVIQFHVHNLTLCQKGGIHIVRRQNLEFGGFLSFPTFPRNHLLNLSLYKLHSLHTLKTLL